MRHPSWTSWSFRLPHPSQALFTARSAISLERVAVVLTSRRGAWRPLQRWIVGVERQPSLVPNVREPPLARLARELLARPRPLVAAVRGARAAQQDGQCLAADRAERASGARVRIGDPVGDV